MTLAGQPKGLERGVPDAGGGGRRFAGAGLGAALGPLRVGWGGEAGPWFE